jgi:Outer membrane protein beta-barrel domain
MNINQHDLSDDELDHLFRDSAEMMDFDFEPDSWTKMSQKLDAVNLPAPSENQAKNVWLKRGLPILLVLLFMTGGYYVFTSSSKQATTTIQTNLKNSSENESESSDKKYVTTDNVNTDNSITEKTNTPESKNDLKNNINTSESVSYENKKTESRINTVSKSEEKSKVLVNEKSVNASKIQKSIIAQKGNSAKIVGNQTFEANKKSLKAKTFSTEKSNENLTNTVTSDAEKSLFVNENIVNNISGKTHKGAKSQKTKENSETNNAQIPTNQSSNISSQTTNNQIVTTNSNAIATDLVEKNERLQLGDIKNITFKNGVFKSNFNLPIIAFSSPKVEPVIPTSKSTSFKKGLYLRLGVSPDYSFITTDETARLGSNWSALLEYRFNKRFSVHSGVIRSMKYYNAYPASYEWPSNWGTIPYSLIDINASCKMFDIPLNFRYDITQNSKNRLFVGAGLTSYVMKNEKYTYNYENPNISGIKWREWEGVSQKKPFYASTLNFSLGYEQHFFRKLSIQAEPFVKVPIKKVGFGKVNLSTIGIFISAKYPIAKF